MKNALDGLIRMDTAEEEFLSFKISQKKLPNLKSKKKENEKKPEQNIEETRENFKRCRIGRHTSSTERETREQKTYLINNLKFLKIKDRHLTEDLGSSE